MYQNTVKTDVNIILENNINNSVTHTTKINEREAFRRWIWQFLLGRY